MSEWMNSNVSSSKTLHQYCKVCKQQVESTRALSSMSQMTDSSDSTEVLSDVCPECTQSDTIDWAGPLSLIDSSHRDVSPSAEQNTHDEIEILFASTDAKVGSAIKNLSISLSELQRQLPVVRKDIKDNLCNFKQIVGMCRDNAFVATQELHSQPWEMTDLFHDIQASADNIVKACESTKVMLNRLNSSELVCLNNSIGTQIINLTKYAYSTVLNTSELKELAPPTSASDISPIVMMNRLGIRIENKFGSLGASTEQFNAPHGFCLGADDEIVIADTNNHRIKVFAMNGTFKFQFGVPGTEEGQLQHPRKVAVMRTDSKFVVCDRGNERSRMQIFSRNGEFINRIFITYINIVTCVAVTNDERIVVVDSVVPKVYFIYEDGTLIQWFEIGKHVMEPSDIAISGSDFYICDYKGHRVAVFTEDGKFQRHIGNEQVTNYPNGICISDAGDICVGDSHGNLLHITCFSRDGVLQSQLICPYVKISRCCGLKITSDGCAVTVAKNNHRVLVLDTRFKFSG